MGSVAQFRVMGGAIGLAIVTTIFNGYIRTQLRDILSSEQVEAIVQYPASIASLSPEIQQIVRATFGNGYNLQAKVLSGLAAGQIPATLLMWQKDQIMV
jgi:hypothetical protein